MSPPRRWGLAGLLVACLAPDLATERVTLTTHFPAPSGVYSRLITTGNTYLARDPGGKVGIGTTSPTAMLDVAGAIRFAAARGELSQLDGNPAVASNGSYPLVFAVNGVEAARIAVGGNLGLGTQSPATRLEIDGSLSFSPGAGYAKICQDMAYEGYAGGPFALCPSNSTPLRMTADYWCVSGGEVQPCALPAAGTMRCCRIAP